MGESLDRKRTITDLESLEVDALAEEEAQSDTDDPVKVKRDSPHSPSWQKRYNSDRPYSDPQT
jgi:hypothetical protein